MHLRWNVRYWVMDARRQVSVRVCFRVVYSVVVADAHYYLEHGEWVGLICGWMMHGD